MTVSDGFCDHCDMPVGACLCAAIKAAEKAFAAKVDNLVADGPTITATQRTPCPGCPRMIVPGDSITHTEDGWAHAEEVSPGERGHTSNDVDWSGI